MSTEIEKAGGISSATLEKVLIGGDLSKLSEGQRVEYYAQTCKSLGLNPLTKPFDYITLNGRLTLYAKRDATDQLRRIYGVSIIRLERERVDDVYVVTAYAKDRDGREDSSVGAVNIKGLAGDNLANALMKAETKAKRRVTLSICGLGMLDETEAETIHEVEVKPVVEVVEPVATVTVPPLPYETAKTVTTSDGKVYDQQDDAALIAIRNSIKKAIAKEADPQRIDELKYKLAAVESIQAHRADHSSQ